MQPIDCLVQQNALLSWQEKVKEKKEKRTFIEVENTVKV